MTTEQTDSNDSADPEVKAEATRIAKRILSTVQNPLSAGMSLDEMLGKLVENRLNDSTDDEAPSEEASPEPNPDLPLEPYLQLEEGCQMCGRIIIDGAPFKAIVPTHNYPLPLCSQICLARLALGSDLVE